MIKIEDATIAYNKEKPIFNKLNLELKKGKIIGLIAPSGSGNTTLLNAIVGLKQLETGNVYIDEIDVKLNKHIYKCGFMPQEYGLYSELTGLQNFNFFRKLLKVKMNKQQINDYFNDFGLIDGMDRLVSDFSGGMKRKLSLMITLLPNPEYLFLDEPTVGIDPIYKELIWDKFRQMADDNKLLLVTTHIMDEAKKCDQLIILDHGEILIDGTYEEILEQVKTDDLETAVIKLIKENK